MNRHFHIYLLLFLCFAFGSNAQTTGKDAALAAKARQLQHDAPDGFIENKGQLYDQNGKSNTAVKYLLHMPGLNVQLRDGGFSYDAWTAEDSCQKFHRVDIALEGANLNARLIASRPLTGTDNVIGERGAFENIHHYQKVTYQNIYPGIDLEFVAKKGTDKPVEYNFIVHPGADASLIKMKYSNGSQISLKDGMIEMDLAFGILREKIPASYTQQDGQSLAVQYKAANESENVYAFEVPAYDKGKTLVIDPTPSVIWSTYYGGAGNEWIQSIDADAAGNIYIAGGSTAGSEGSIATAGSFQSTLGGNNDMFIVKFTAAGTRLWGTYFGGASNEASSPSATRPMIKVTGSFIYITGASQSTGMATLGQVALAGGFDGLIGKFNTADGTRVWSTYYGGTGDDYILDLFVHTDGSLYVTGSSASDAGIATAGAMQTTRAGLEDGFIARFDANGNRIWGTYLGGTAAERSYGLAVDAGGDAYITGYTASTSGLTTLGAFQEVSAGGGSDIFLARINNTGSTKVWCTYWGGDGSEVGYDLKIDPAGNLIALGSTGTINGAGAAVSNGLASPGAMHTSPMGFRDVVIGKFTTSGSRLWSTYYGGEGYDMAMALDLDESGNILLAGDGFMTGVTFTAIAGTPSTGLASNCTYQPAIAGLNEAFIAKISSDGNSRLWASYFGSSQNERAMAIRYVGSGNFLIAGITASGFGITTSGAYQTVYGGGGTCDAFLARFSEGMAPSDVMVTATTLSPMSQTACTQGIPAIIAGNAISLYNPPGFTSPIFYQWQVADDSTGTWTNIVGEIFKDLQPLPGSTNKYYRRLVLVNDGFCDTKAVDTSYVATVLVNSNVAPIANADGPQWYVCGAGANTVTLNGSATGGSGVYSSYEWFAGTNLTVPVATTNSFTPTITAMTTYTLKVTDNAGCQDVDQVTVVPSVANAGPDVNMCEASGGVQIGQPGIPGGSVTYQWTSVSGDPVTSLSCSNCAQPIANVAATSTYQLQTTVLRKDGTTCSTTDQVTITFVTSPVGGTSFAGTDQTICKNTSVVLGGTNDATATYNWAPTSYLSASNIFNPTFNAGTNTVNCPVTYTVTAAKQGCIFTDQVNVSVIDAGTSLDGQSIGCGGWTYGGSSNCNGATYSWQLVSGPGVVPTGNSLQNGGANAYLVNNGGANAVYRRVTTLNGVSCNSGDITITPCGSGSGGCPVTNIQIISPQGCPKVFGTQELQLNVSGINAADYSFAWTPANIMDNPNAPVVTITATTPTTVGVTLTNIITGQVCTPPSLAINNPSWSLPVMNGADTVFSCAGSTVTIGESAAVGFSYLWTPSTGLSSPTLADPTATVASSTLFNVTKTDNSNSCKVTKDVLVSLSEFIYDAGPSHAVCNGATVTLGTAPGGSYTYSWTPLNAAWTNGTGPTDANPQVLFASTSQTFNVVVTDPISGCQKTDTITLSGTITPGEYAGPAVGPLCPGQTAQLGTTPVANATYSWSSATGLSCTTCANPTITAGTTSQAYSVMVSYPGCSTPVTDNVSVTVNSLPTVTLTDKTICPATPTNIGIGGAGNTASLAGVASYLWSPASGLSCTNCASPDANPQTATTYNVIITLTNGCVITEDVAVTPAVQATAKPDATICPGGSVVLGSPAVPDVTYSWTVLSGTAGSVNPVNIAQPTANPIATSVYRLTATGTGPNAGCTVIDDATVTVKTLPVITIAGGTAVCENGATTLSVTPVTPNIIYQWSPLAGVISPNSPITAVEPDSTTVYRVIQTDLNSGCSAYEEITVTVWPNNVTATGGAITICPGTSDTLPLTVSPVGGNTIAWSPATNLSDAYVQNPVAFPQSTTAYIATVTNDSSSCSDTAIVTVTVLPSCNGSDYGDAPITYDGTIPASHGISDLIRIGNAIDGESAPASASMNAIANGDDSNNPINDEEGVSFLPTPNTGSQSLSVIVNNIVNNTADAAYLVSWIDFNRDGDFHDAGEQSQIVTLSPNTVVANPIMQFSGFNSGCVVQAGPSYLRVRVTTDTTNNWKNTPQPDGSRSNGEVEDYSLILMGSDFGDAPVIYPMVRATVNPDLNNNGSPDAAGSVWLGNTVDYSYSCNYIASTSAYSDDGDNAGNNDEDGLQMSSQVPIGTPVPWTITVNSQGPVTAAQWGMWIDWNADGVFDDFYHDSVNTSSPTPVTVNVTAPANATTGFIVRVAAKAPGTPFAPENFNSNIINGEWEDYIRSTPLPLSLLYFNATANVCMGEISWATASERNCDYFEIEQSSDGRNWKAVQRIPSAGTSDEVQQYNAEIPLTSGANNYLRLNMVDKDGNHEYSMIRVIRCDGQSPILVWPNPSEMKVQVSGLPDGGTIQVSEISGKEVIHLKNISATEIINIGNLPSGIYQITVLDHNGNRIDVQKLVKK